MSLAVAVLGSGKMARNIGLWLVRAGHRVTFFASTMPLCDDCGRHIRKKFSRLRELSDGSFLEPPQVRLAGSAASETYDIVVEATTESLEVKQRRFSEISALITPRTLHISATSSIFPSRICQDCIGMHFFYPVELTGFVELIAETAAPKEKTERVKSFAASCNLKFIVENEENAFCANRLLLPVQTEAIRTINRNYAAYDVDECTRSDLLPSGQLSMMDGVGLETIRQSVSNYLFMMPSDERDDYAVLPKTLRLLASNGKQGRKINNGLLCGTPRAQGTRTMDANERSAFSRTFLFLFVNTCRTFMERRLIDGASLDTILSMAFHAGCTLSDVLEREGSAIISEYCNSRFLATGLSYFKPSRLLARAYG